MNIGNFLQRNPVLLNYNQNQQARNAVAQAPAAPRQPRLAAIPPPRLYVPDSEDEGSKWLKECKQLKIKFVIYST